MRKKINCKITTKTVETNIFIIRNKFIARPFLFQ